MKSFFLDNYVLTNIRKYVRIYPFAAVVKSADTKDLKSFGSNSVPVQVRSAAPHADMAELADALDSGSSDFTVIQVQVLLSAPWRVFITDLRL